MRTRHYASHVRTPLGALLRLGAAEGEIGGECGEGGSERIGARQKDT